MFDKLVCNKYFVIALIVIIIVLLFLYLRKKSCGVEKMENVDLTLHKSGVEDAVNDVTKYRADNKDIKPKDEVYQKYLDFDKHEEPKPKQQKKLKLRPIDNRPDLGNCAPCICPNDRRSDDYDNDFFEDSTEEDYGYPTKEAIRRSLALKSELSTKKLII